MIYKKYSLFLLILLSFTYCNKNDNKISNFQIANYKLTFPKEVIHEQLDGIDSEVGKFIDIDYSLVYEYGWYTGKFSNSDSINYIIIEKEINGHYIQIVKPEDAYSNSTRLHVYNISDELNAPYGFNKLTISSNNLSKDQQDEILSIYNSLEIN